MRAGNFRLCIFFFFNALASRENESWNSTLENVKKNCSIAPVHVYADRTSRARSLYIALTRALQMYITPSCPSLGPGIKPKMGFIPILPCAQSFCILFTRRFSRVFMSVTRATRCFLSSSYFPARLCTSQRSSHRKLVSQKNSIFEAKDFIRLADVAENYSAE